MFCNKCNKETKQTKEIVKGVSLSMESYGVKQHKRTIEKSTCLVCFNETLKEIEQDD